MQIQTERLKLVACTAPMARAALNGRRQIETLIGARISEEWLAGDLKDFLPIYARQIESDASELGWGIWLMIHRTEKTLVGDLGFKGKPDESGTVDLGYLVISNYRRQGYAFEATSSLVKWAFAQPPVKRIIAQCNQDNA